MKPRIYIVSLLLLLLFINNGCKKYLDAKSNQSLVTISSAQDLQSLLDNSNTVNLLNPSADEVSTDEYYLTFSDYQAMDFDQERNMYTWQPDNLFYPYTNITNDWTQAYNNVYIANTVLDNMDQVQRSISNASVLDNIKGQALFLRAYSFYKIVSIWALAYDPNTSNTDLGIPLRLNSNFNEQSKRSTVTESYNQIITDANNAAALLSITPAHVYRAAKPAAYALLARAYLSMRKYDQSRLYADSSLQLTNTLMDYNKLNTSATYPIPMFNQEIIYDTRAGGTGAAPISKIRAKVDTVLYATYIANDLRKVVFFSPNADGSMFFKGSYEGASSRFNGIAIDEMYLTRAECYARQGNINSALSDLNTLLKNRYKSGLFTPITAVSSTDALSKILAERQKELIMRGTRWMDIKRLNKEGYGINLERVLNGTTYTLPANSLRFALPLPDDIIALSGMQQNPR